MASVVELESKFLECHICLETYRRPKTIPCLHSFCEHCLRDYILTCRELQGVRFPCPVCKQVVTCPDPSLPRHQWAASFKGSFFLNDLADCLKQASGSTSSSTEPPSSSSSSSSSSPCSLCGNQDASRFCLDCDHRLCGPCCALHDKIPTSSHHHVVDYARAASPALHHRRRRRFCRAHADRVLELYCGPCRAALCQMCHLTSHKLCAGVLPLVEAAEKKRAWLKEVGERAESYVTRLSRASDSLARGLEAANRQRVGDAERVKEFFIKAASALRQKQDELMADLDSTYQHHCTALLTAQREREELVTALGTARDVTRTLLEAGADWEVLGEGQGEGEGDIDLGQRLQVLLQRADSLPPLHTPPASVTLDGEAAKGVWRYLQQLSLGVTPASPMSTTDSSQLPGSENLPPSPVPGGGGHCSSLSFDPSGKHLALSSPVPGSTHAFPFPAPGSNNSSPFTVPSSTNSSSVSSVPGSKRLSLSLNLPGSINSSSSIFTPCGKDVSSVPSNTNSSSPSLCFDPSSKNWSLSSPVPNMTNPSWSPFAASCIPSPSLPSPVPSCHNSSPSPFPNSTHVACLSSSLPSSTNTSTSSSCSGGGGESPTSGLPPFALLPALPAQRRTPKLLKRIKTRTGLDRDKPQIWDLAVLPRGQLILVDGGNSCIKGMNMAASASTVCRLSLKSPLRVCKLTDSQVAVTARDKKLYVISVTDKLEATQWTDTQHEYWGLARVSDDTLAASCPELGCLHLIDLNARVLRSISSSSSSTPLFHSPAYLSAAPDGDLLVSDSGKQCIYRLAPSGEMKFRFPCNGPLGLQSPRGVCCDWQGGVLCVDREGQQVVRLTGQGRLAGSLLTTVHGLSFPQALAVGHNGVVYVTSDAQQADTQDVLVFEIQ